MRARSAFDDPDAGVGGRNAAQVHSATLTILAYSTARVMTVAELKGLVTADAVANAAAWKTLVGQAGFEPTTPSPPD